MAEVAFEGWAVLELMGHRTRPGYVKEVEMAGGKMMRVDIPVSEEITVTEFYGCSAIYSLRPATEAVVRNIIKNDYNFDDPRPVRPVDFREPERLPAPSSQDHLFNDEPEEQEAEEEDFREGPR